MTDKIISTFTNHEQKIVRIIAWHKGRKIYIDVPTIDEFSYGENLDIAKEIFYSMIDKEIENNDQQRKN